VEFLESRIASAITVAMFLVVLAVFAGVSLTHGNTFALVDPVVRWVQPAASSAEIDRIHMMARKFGHFLIPAVAFALLVIGPLRRRPGLALALCALFAMIDESLQSFIPGRTGSVADVMLDTSGAVVAYFVYRAILSTRPDTEGSRVILRL
jgi:VanZ family protein